MDAEFNRNRLGRREVVRRLLGKQLHRCCAHFTDVLTSTEVNEQDVDRKFHFPWPGWGQLGDPGTQAKNVDWKSALA